MSDGSDVRSEAPPKRRRPLSSRVIFAGFVGFAVGNLPGDGPVWLGVKAAFTVAMFVLLFRATRREASDITAPSRGYGEPMTTQTDVMPDGESRFDLDMDPREHAPGGPYGGAWRHTLGPKGKGEMVFRIEAELKIALLRELLADERAEVERLREALREVRDTVRMSSVKQHAADRCEQIAVTALDITARTSNE